MALLGSWQGPKDTISPLLTASITHLRISVLAYRCGISRFLVADGLAKHQFTGDLVTGDSDIPSVAMISVIKNKVNEDIWFVGRRS